MTTNDLRDNAIDWNWNQFFRAVDQGREKDARRYRENIRRLEGVRE